MFKKYILALLIVGLFQSSTSSASFQEEERRDSFKTIYRGGLKLLMGSFVTITFYCLDKNFFGAQEQNCPYSSGNAYFLGGDKQINSEIDLSTKLNNHCYGLVQGQMETNNQNSENLYTLIMISSGLVICNGVSDISKGVLELCSPHFLKKK